MARPPLASSAMGCASLEALRVSISSCNCCSCLLYFVNTCSFSYTGMAILRMQVAWSTRYIGGQPVGLMQLMLAAYLHRLFIELLMWLLQKCLLQLVIAPLQMAH